MSATAGANDLSVVICTLDRPAGALAAVRSVLREDPAADVVVVDQSASADTRELLAREAGRARVIRSARRGLSAARNLGVGSSSGAIIAFTDDDCEAMPGWLDGFRRAFASDDRIALVFGNVLAPEYDREAGFVPAYRVPRFHVADALGEKAGIEGMGACMAVRRSAWAAFNGFDELLGSGARFRAGEDTDFAVRALVNRWKVAETPDASVLHHGFRTWAQGRDLIDGYMYGLGATNAKMLRLGRLRAIRPLAALAWRWVAGAPVVDLNQLPPRLPRLRSFVRGALDGYRLPMAGGRFG